MSEEVTVVPSVLVVEEEGKASFKSYNEMIEYFKNKIDSISKLTLVTCWEMGQEVNLIKKSAVYGQKTIENFATSLNIPDMNIKRLYRYAQFASEYTRDELDAAMNKKHVGWGVINKLISVKDKEDRTEFEDKIASEEIQPSKLDQEISEYMTDQSDDAEEGTTDTATTGTAARRSYMKHCKKGTTAIAILKDVIPLATKDIQDIDDIADNEDQYNKTLDAIYDFREAVEEIMPLLEELDELAGKIA